MINHAHDADLKNNGKETKVFLIKEFEDFIPFCDPEKRILSLFGFSLSTEVQDVINSLQTVDVVKTAAIEITKSLLDINFGIENNFCDEHQLKHYCKETKVPDVFFSFFTVFNVGSTKLIRSEITSGINDCLFEDRLVKESRAMKRRHRILF